MASINREIIIDVPSHTVWDALRDVGALHTRLVPGFVTDTRLEAGARVVTFGNGQVIRELIVDLNESDRRLVWAVVDGPFKHYSASAQVFDDGPTRCRFVWIADLLPNEMANGVATMMEQGLGVLKQTMERSRRNSISYVYSTAHTGDLHDFDFIAGSWTMVNRRLNTRGAGSTEWDVFPGESRGQVYMGGIVNVDENVFPTKGWSGVTMRLFDIEKRQWSIYWVNSRDGKLQPPVVGGFDGDVGLFYGEDEDEGRPVKAVFKWTKMGPNAARWEQSFSYDDGESWETNWIIELARK
jgi:hypothetical protein